jgi:putative component of membrane protein insertase Oxa1/YidC/SpoIIIJ protein YidD
MADNKTLSVIRNVFAAIPQRRKWVYGLLLGFLVAVACLKPAAIVAIRGYQRFISPHKGYRRAYGVLYGSPSCSESVKRSIRQYRVVGGLILLRQRFQACHQAAVVLHNSLGHPSRPRADDCFEGDRDRGKREGKEARDYCDGCVEGCCE